MNHVYDQIREHGPASEAQMTRHVTVLGALNIAVGLSGLIAIPIVLASMVGSGLFTEEWEQVVFMSTLGFGIAFLVAMFSIPPMVAGVALIRGARWAHRFGLVVSALNLLNIPFGTPVGIYGLWVLSRQLPEPVPAT